MFTAPSKCQSQRLTGPAVPLIYKALGVRPPNNGILHAEWESSQDALTITIQGDLRRVMARTENNGTLCILAINRVSAAQKFSQLNPDGTLMLAVLSPPEKLEVSAPPPNNEFYDKVVCLRQQTGDAFRAVKAALGPANV